MEVPGRTIRDLQVESLSKEKTGRVKSGTNPTEHNLYSGQYAAFSSVIVSRLPDISVKAADDKKDCHVTGMTFLPPDTLLVADYFNRCVKQLNDRTDVITSCLQLSSEPYDITKLGTIQAAVTLPNENKLQIISIESGLTLERTMSLNGECNGVDFAEDKLFLSFVDPVKIEILDLSGTVLLTLTNDTIGQLLLSKPCHLRAVYERGHPVVYISDFGANSVTKMSTDGKVLFTYKDEDLLKPRGLGVTDEGQILVCGYQSHNVQAVSQDGKKAQTLLNEANGVLSPLSMCYSTKENKVFVSCNNLQVYKLC